VTDHSLKSVNDRSLGEPLPHQQANRTQAHLIAAYAFSPLGVYIVLPIISNGYSILRGRFLRVTHPFATLIGPEGLLSFDLHVLGVPPAFNLSQDQTLFKNLILDFSLEF
jgi:hypothetical protein